MKLQFFLYVIILGLVLNLLANMIWKYLPGTDYHIDKIVTAVLVSICIVLLFFYREENNRSDLSQQKIEIGPHSADVHANIDGLQIVTQGNVTVGTIVHRSQIEQLIINPGDAPQVKKQKIEQAKNVIVHEILANIAAIDIRLGYVGALSERDTFEEKLRTTRQKVAPSAQEAATSGYGRLIAENRISSLRQAMNSNPLRPEFGQPLIQVLIDSEVDVTPIRSFYDQLAEVQWATEQRFPEGI